MKKNEVCIFLAYFVFSFVLVLLLAPSYTFGAESMTSAKEKIRIEDPQNNCAKDDWPCKWTKSVGKNDPMLRLDGEDISKHQLMYDFIKSSISRHLWMENAPYPALAVFSNFDRPKKEEKKNLAENNPSELEFLYRTKGYPKAAALVRRNKNITIGFGVPPGPPIKGHPGWQYRGHWQIYSPQEEKANETIKRQILHLAPLITALTGLKIIIVADGHEDYKHPANLRIFSNAIFAEHKNKSLYPVSFMKAGIQFTPDNAFQVEGYLMPNEKNVIEYSECRIRPDIAQAEISDYTTECLLRSLGLPELIDTKAKSAFSAWASPMERQGQVLGEPPHCPAPNWCIYSTPDKAAPVNKVGDTKTSPLFSEISEYDQKIISILYCRKIKPGMDSNALAVALYKSTECFSYK